MGNAAKEIQTLADFVTDTNEEEGVLKVLKMLSV
jgi:hydroxymethylpyrimidine pyrophosphatase-like HAD family hydrolase